MSIDPSALHTVCSLPNRPVGLELNNQLAYIHSLTHYVQYEDEDTDVGENELSLCSEVGFDVLLLTGTVSN